jgi:hypothetical protein
MLGLLFGAGFSKWALDLPLAHQLFDFQITPFGVREATKLVRITRLKNNWDRENPREIAEKFIADALIRHDINKELVLWYIVRRLSEPFIWEDRYTFRTRRHILMVDENRKYEIEGMRKAQVFISSIRAMKRLSGIVTTNYDLVIEYALGTSGYNYGERGQRLIGRGAHPVSQWIKPIILSGDISIAKIHGSLSWDENGYYSDGRRGLTGNALIVAPTPEKEPAELLRYHWDLAEQILNKASDLIVFGFAFNPYDVAVLNLLKSSGKNLRRVLLIDIFPKLDAAKSLWPQAEISESPPPPEGQEFISNWLM